MKFLITVSLLFLLTGVYAQSDTEPLNSINYGTVERLEILSGSLKNDLHLTYKGVSRESLTNFAIELDTSANFNLSEIDLYNLEHIYKDNNGLVPDEYFIESVKPIWKHFYKTPAHLFDIHTDAIDLQVNPIYYGNISYDNKLTNNFGFINTRGAQVRAIIDDKVSVFTSVTENMTAFPRFLRWKIDSLRSIPGAGFYHSNRRSSDSQERTYDYFVPKASVGIDVSEHISAQLGYDQHFIGDGYRSLFLSQNANNAAYLKLNTKFWKINYTNLYQELATYGQGEIYEEQNDPKSKKYMVSHHLSFDATDWLNIGLFESIIFARENQFEFHYLNPIIFFRAIEHQVGSPDNVLIGLNYSALIKNRIKLYGQLVIDEFRIDDIRSGEKHWTNKFAFQQGAKYINAFGIDQFDLQAEVNRTRPYTYMHDQVITNYTHYGSAIAHPLASNFTEWVGIANYQPFKKLRMQGILTYADYGTDPDVRSWGSDIYKKTYADRPFETGVETGQGIANKSVNAQGRISYELKHNLNLDLQGVYKAHKVKGNARVNESYFGASIRWNFGAYDYNF